ncbi:MAG TPA: YwiC-like family protein [Candidatus Limnocylindrales bacterium]
MLAVPFLLGVAASTPSAWQALLAAASVLGYLASATGQAWLRARRRDAVTLPRAVYAASFGALGALLIVAFPPLLATLVVLGPSTALIVSGARPGTRRDLVNSLAQAAQAVVLVPSAAWVSGAFSGPSVVAATAVAAAYLLGTVLVVRSVLRERESRGFTALSTGFHAVLAAPALLLGPVWALLAAGLAIRAAALPLVARRRAGTPRPLKPVHVGAVEAVVAIVVVVVAFVALP